MVEWKKLGDFAMLQKTKNRKHVTENAYSITQAGLVPTKSFFKEKTNITSNDTSGYYIVEKEWFVYSPSRIDVGSISYLKDEGPVIVSPIDVVFSIDKTVCLPSFLLISLSFSSPQIVSPEVSLYNLFAFRTSFLIPQKLTYCHHH